MPGKPLYPLDTVKKLAAAGFAQIRPSAKRQTMADLGGSSEGEAERLVSEVIEALLPEAFYRREPPEKSFQKFADSYGLNYDGAPWYVKFYIDDSSQLLICSCHAPTQEIVRADGKVIRPPKR